MFLWIPPAVTKSKCKINIEKRNTRRDGFESVSKKIHTASPTGLVQPVDSTFRFRAPLHKLDHVRFPHSLHPPIKDVRLVEGCHPMLRRGGRPGRGRPRRVRCAEQGHGVVPCRSDARGAVSLRCRGQGTDIREHPSNDVCSEFRHRVDVLEVAKLALSYLLS